MSFVAIIRSSIILIILGLTLLLGSSTGKITGRIVDAETEKPLPGCNIIVNNTVLGSSSDIDGYFTFYNITYYISYYNILTI